MINYDTQISQIPTAYYYGGMPQGSSRKKNLGMMVIGGLIGMNAYYMPVKKDVFVQRGFDMERDIANSQIATLKKIAQEVEKNKVSTESLMFLQDMGLIEDVGVISARCTSIKERITNPLSVKAIKDHYIDSFDTHGKNTHLMDALSSDAFKAVRRNKFRWGVGIGAGIGLALGLITSRT